MIVQGLEPVLTSTRRQAAPELDPADIGKMLGTLGQVLYRWDVASDRLEWLSGAMDVFGFADGELPDSGKAYAAYLDPDNLTSRYDAIVNASQHDSGSGVAFDIQYRLLPERHRDGRRIWVEDSGRWFAGDDGRPAYAVGCLRAANARIEHEQRLAYLSRFDDLTGQLNRGRLLEIMDEVLDEAKRHRKEVVFAVAAVDGLKVINEVYGFDVADQVIANVARRLKSRLRCGDALGRLSGNKLGILFLDCSEADFAIAAKRLTGAVADEVIVTDAGPLTATVSIGGVSLPRHARGAQEALVRAHEALDICKSGNRGGALLYAPDRERDERRRANMALSAEIVDALNERRIRLAYQPIVDVTTREVVFEEALLRLLGPNGEVVPAGRFIPLAEKLGLVRLLDRRALELAIDALSRFPQLRLTINVSTWTSDDTGWLDLFSSSLANRPDMAARLMVEITESAAIRDLDDACRFVETVRDLGAKIAIDDFGAGYTSFLNLKHLKVDVVKIDGSFVRNLTRDTRDQKFVRTLVDLAQTFAAKTVAEWVTSEEAAAMLSGYGVDYLQGELTGGATLSPPWAERGPQIEILAG
ncbi:MAG: EAL domain-containing protein [Hyphomicrobiaceae bacterium]|nr:EAL domain-containing protein [Hyphomicrobiaceae bacterium]